MPAGQPASQLTLSASFEAMAGGFACFCLPSPASLAAEVIAALVGHCTAEEVPRAPKTQNLAVLCTSIDAALIKVAWPGAATRSKGKSNNERAWSCSLFPAESRNSGDA